MSRKRPRKRGLALFFLILVMGGVVYLASMLPKQNHNQVVDDPESVEVFVSKANKLPDGYEPPDLSLCNVPGVREIEKKESMLREEAARALEKMFAAAMDEEGYTLYMISGYRSFEHQTGTYNSVKKAKGEEYANQFIAVPGHSEHQTGLAMDITNIDHMDDDHEKQLGTMPEGIWLRENAHRFGFILRYPEGKEDITGYSYEPWHFRYVGVELATEIYTKGVTLDEYMQTIQ